ncbi:MAG: FeoB-associated Cys-rich membrane protein [Oscillospiraceae bacterium]|nr:FeoB-associated Cys-rich membrane protein [Oscillospiraceae bacterium]
MNIWDILILIAVIGAVIVALWRIRHKKAGGCSCGCEGCLQTCEKRKPVSRPEEKEKRQSS